MLAGIEIEIILQIIGILVVVFGGAAGFWYIKRKNIVIDEDYFKLANQIATLIDGSIKDDNQLKQITRTVMKTVQWVEANMTNAPNDIKEDTAVDMFKEALKALNLKKPLDDQTIRQIIRIACMFLEATNK